MSDAGAMAAHWSLRGGAIALLACIATAGLADRPDDRPGRVELAPLPAGFVERETARFAERQAVVPTSQDDDFAFDVPDAEAMLRPVSNANIPPAEFNERRIVFKVNDDSGMPVPLMECKLDTEAGRLIIRPLTQDPRLMKLASGFTVEVLCSLRQRVYLCGLNERRRANVVMGMTDGGTVFGGRQWVALDYPWPGQLIFRHGDQSSVGKLQLRLKDEDLGFVASIALSGGGPSPQAVITTNLPAQLAAVRAQASREIVAQLAPAHGRLKERMEETYKIKDATWRQSAQDEIREETRRLDQWAAQSRELIVWEWLDKVATAVSDSPSIEILDPAHRVLWELTMKVNRPTRRPQDPGPAPGQPQRVPIRGRP